MVAETSDLRAVRGWVSGRVQGVGFRWFVLQSANSLGLAGEVRNLPDGRVEFRAQGQAEEVAQLLTEIARGPSEARVEGVEATDIDPDPGLGSFDVRH